MIAWIQRVYNKLKEHMDNYTGVRASKLDNLDASISSRLASNDSRLNYLDAPISSAGNTVTVQRGRTAVDADSNDDIVTNVTISAVDTSKAFVNIAYRSYGGVPEGAYISARLTSATNLEIRAVAYYDGWVQADVDWEVIEIA